MQLALPLAALLALLASLAAGWREYSTALALAGARIEAEVETVMGTLRDHMAERETLARAVGAAFLPPLGIEAGALGEVDRRLLTYVPDLFSFVWVQQVHPDQVDDALAALRQSGVAAPAILGPGRRSLAEDELKPPLVVVLDILPATGQNRSSLGLNLASLPLPREALARAEAQGDIAATAPLELVQLPGVRAFVLYVPVADRRGPEGATLGYLGFSFRFDTLLGSALEGVATPGPLRVLDTASPDPLVFASEGWTEGAPGLVRSLRFGGREWRVEFAAAGGQAGAVVRGLVVGGLTLLAFTLILLVARHLLRTSAHLEHALAARLAAEERLRVLVGELAHRIKNVYAMAGSIAAQTFREVDPDGRARDAFASRLQSLAGATTLISEGAWRHASLRALVHALELPFANRVTVHGDDLEVSPQAAQSLALLVHELWTNAAKHGALTAPEGRVELAWELRGGRFHLTWQEKDGPPLARLPERQGFGRRLLERLVPDQLGGTGRLVADPLGVRYELVVPQDQVVAGKAEHVDGGASAVLPSLPNAVPLTT